MRDERNPDESSGRGGAVAASVLYDAQEYLVAGAANHAEWWEHLGDAHRDYAQLAQLAVEQAEALNELREQEDSLRAALVDALEALDHGERWAPKHPSYFGKTADRVRAALVKP